MLFVEAAERVAPYINSYLKEVVVENHSGKEGEYSADNLKVPQQLFFFHCNTFGLMLLLQM